jgi:integrase
LAATQVRDFDTGAGTLTFTKTKSGKVRHVPLTAEAVGHFKLWTAGKQSGEFIFTCEDGSAWLKSQQSRRMRDACAAARIEPAVTFHVLRHTFASLLVLQGTPLKFVSEVLGHSDSRMVEIHYAHLQKNDAVAKAIRQNLPSFGAADIKIRTI